jgi:hypothetical protein
MTVAEAVVRLSRLPPPSLILRSHYGVQLMDGVPVWENLDKERCNEDCPARKGPGAATVLVFGDSILYGSGVTTEQVFTLKLESKLDAAGRTSCVLNLSVPGISLSSKLALARRRVPKHRPDIIYWGGGARETVDFAMLGDSAYDLKFFEVGPDGYPSAFGLPGPLNRLLFRNLRFYENLTLRLAAQRKIDWVAEWKERVIDRFPAIVELARRERARLVLVHCPMTIHQDFAEVVLNPSPEHALFLEAAARLGVDVINLAEEFVDQNTKEILLDPYCHFNAKAMICSPMSCLKKRLSC